MIIRSRHIEVISRKEFEMIDLTPQVEAFVQECAVADGMVFVMTAHTTSSIVVTEGVECLERDIPLHLERLAPKNPEPGTFGYYHNRLLDFDGRLGFNAGDHLKSLLHPTPAGDWVSVATVSKGEYGVPAGMVFGYPVTGDGKGNFAVVTGVKLDDFGKAKFAATLKELEGEKDEVKDLLK